jgi:hypothetical protein
MIGERTTPLLYLLASERDFFIKTFLPSGLAIVGILVLCFLPEESGPSFPRPPVGGGRSSSELEEELGSMLRFVHRLHFLWPHSVQTSTSPLLTLSQVFVWDDSFRLLFGDRLLIAFAMRDWDFGTCPLLSTPPQHFHGANSAASMRVAGSSRSTRWVGPT